MTTGKHTPRNKRGTTGTADPAENAPIDTGKAGTPAPPAPEQKTRGKKATAAAAPLPTKAVAEQPAASSAASHPITQKKSAPAGAKVPAAGSPSATGKQKAGGKTATPKKKKKLAAPVTEAVTQPASKKRKTPGKEPAAVHADTSSTLQVAFQLRFYTHPGQSLWITGNHPLLGNGDPLQALPMQYLDHEHWQASLSLNREELAATPIVYHYLWQKEDGSLEQDWGNDKILDDCLPQAADLLIIDSWNHAGYVENAFYTEPFKKVLLKQNYTAVPAQPLMAYTHLFKVKAPLLPKGQVLCLLGNHAALGNWQTDNPLLLSRSGPEADYWEVQLEADPADFPLVYKYGVYDLAQQQWIAYESGRNRVLYTLPVLPEKTIVNDGFALLPSHTWKGAGLAIPVFSLRSNNSLGTGEFTDLRLLVDWARQTGLRLIQVLPVNDTIATGSWTDSYPYSAISAFALHPLYLNVGQVAGVANSGLLDAIAEEKQRLNQLPVLDYEAVVQLKLQLLRQLYELQGAQVLSTPAYRRFFAQNKHWLLPYAAFCYLRDLHGTTDFTQWKGYESYHAKAVVALVAEEGPAHHLAALYYFIQFHLHVQLQEAAAYAHRHGIILKGDIAIGIYRNSVDAWQQPDLFHMDRQAGAPPDDFAVKGQNWGFPTYNWAQMRKDGFSWWKKRFEQMRYYFDAFRIDHILGFFRIWSIPVQAVEGIMGYFVPAIPVAVQEFAERNTWFDYHRYTRPFINGQVLGELFGNDQDYIKQTFLVQAEADLFHLQPGFATQQQVQQYFEEQEENDRTRRARQGLFDLISNVILFEAPGSHGQQFHFRFGMMETSSFRHLDPHTQQQLNDLYVHYFFRRQDDFWREEALQKLPALKQVTNMLICGEDLGMVPGCVPEVMKQLGILSLEIQRMPKDAQLEFFHPAQAPYLSVVTPSTHDMSTLRGWWEEDRQRTQRFYNMQLHQWGEAPYFCEPWINRAIVMQHLASPAMWSIFQLQDLLGTDAELRRSNPNEERINVPANPRHYWRYRMHLTLEALLEATVFNAALLAQVKESGR